MSLLSIKFLKQIDRLQIRTQRSFRGRFKGERRSLNRGAGTEFADYRSYEHGDDLRYVDWNIYARLDRLCLKLFTAEEDLPVFVFIDSSRSMDFGTPTKLERTKQIAAALGYIALTNYDRVSIYTISDQLTPIAPLTYGKAQFPRLSKAIANIMAEGATDLTTCLKSFVAQIRQPGLVMIISDFWSFNQHESGIKQLLARGFDLTLVHLLSREEISPQFSGELQLADAETGQSKEITVNEQTIAAYTQRLDTFCEGVKRFCLNRGVTYIRIDNQIPIEQFILKDLRQSGVTR